MNAPHGLSMRSAVLASRLSKRYRDTVAVDDLDLDIAPGEFVGLLGPNGSGKTTTLHMLATLVRPSAGSATVAGFDVEREPVRVRQALGLVFQESALDRSLTVAQNLRFAGLLHDLAPRLIDERSGELLELFELDGRRDAPVAALSGGMRRALDIVRGVLHHPRCLLLDEPTIGLDLPNRRRIWRFIERLRARTHMTVLLTTHYLEEADGCDRVVFIRKGRLVESGPPHELVARLGRRILEVEGADLASLQTRLGPGLRDGDVVQFRCREEDLADLQLATRASTWRVRQPNLNDVFLWVAAGRSL